MVTPDDLVRAADAVVAALRPAIEADWSRPAGSIEWSCRQTLDHLPDTLLLYAAHLASRAPRGLPYPRVGDPSSSAARLLRVTEATAHILAEVVVAAPPTARAYHPAGMADPEGFCAMGCDELLVHAADLAFGLGVEFTPPPTIAARVRDRLFPWAPKDLDPWATLWWANGRGELPGHARLGPDWHWHCAPLAEWDGATEPGTESS